MKDTDVGLREDAPDSAPAPDGAKLPVWPIEVLVGDGREALIRHDAQLYRLRVTAQNKLILTK